MRIPPAVLLAVLALPAAAPGQGRWVPPDPKVACASAADKTLCAELLAVRDRDQAVRYRELDEGSTPAVVGEAARVDRENLARVEAIVAARGWPGRSLVGDDASGAAWTVIQHADLPVQERYLAMMTKAADAGDLDRGLLATTVDRVAVAQGKPQTYGTQFREVGGRFVPFPIADEAHVDERREKVGLGPLAEYAETMRRVYAAPAKP
jgi:hypothetical protein